MRRPESAYGTDARGRAVVDPAVGRCYLGNASEPFPGNHFAAQHPPEERLNYRHLLLSSVVVGVAFVIALAASGLDPLVETDAWCHDAYHLLAGKRYAAEHTLIVSLDNERIPPNKAG